MDWKKTSFYTGMAIVVGTHVAMLPDYVPMDTYEHRRNHALFNLLGAGLIFYGTLD